ncbi:MAG: cupin [Rhodospirillaceae bacterium]|nr:cupin [Rhodospirillaceae bacterium]|tara:strand:- start:202 stop:573 length:372 start_codon:yes stop_codon:yes gene_type:complete
MTNLYKKSFDDADEIKSPPKTHAAVVKLGNINATKLVLEPGWKWSECVKPAVGGDSCQAGHVGVIVQGTLKCVHNDGTEIEASAGDAYYFAPGHDGWVVGDETVIGYEFADTGKDFGPWKTAS